MLQKTLDEFSPTDTCPDCGNEYERLNQHHAMSDCGPDDPSKSVLECENCGDEFKEYTYRVDSDRDRDGVAYCSTECKNSAARQGEYVDCDWCGDETYKSPSHLENDDHHFCSTDCENEWRSGFMSGENGPQWNGGKESVTCERCGETYEITPALTEITRFCSRECQLDAIRPGDEQRRWRTEACEACGDDVTRRPSEFTGEVAVCNMDCFADWMSETKRGHKNPAWKGGKRTVERVRSALGQRSWQRIADEQREKAGHECEECEASPNDRRLSVHHIIPVASGGTHGDWNLMVLCNQCHRRIENATKKFTEPHLFAPLHD